MALPLPSQQQKCRITKKKAKGEEVELAQTISFSPKFVRKDAIPFFAQARKPTLTAWNSLLLATTLPETITRECLHVFGSGRSPESIDGRKGGSPLPPRFSYV